MKPIGKKRASNKVTALGRGRQTKLISGECDGQEIPQESKETRIHEAPDEEVLTGFTFRDID
jgi:hypothetical protein